MKEKKIEFPLELGKYSYIQLIEWDIGYKGYQISNIDKVPIKVGKFTSIAHSLSIMGTEHNVIKDRKYVTSYPFGAFDTYWGKDLPELPERGEIIIGNDVWIGANVTLRTGITINDGAIIGANSVIVKNVGPYEFVAGNPATHKRLRYSLEQIRQLRKIKWWDWDEQKIKDNLKYFSDIDEFLKRFGDNDESSY